MRMCPVAETALKKQLVVFDEINQKLIAGQSVNVGVARMSESQSRSGSTHHWPMLLNIDSKSL